MNLITAFALLILFISGFVSFYLFLDSFMQSKKDKRTPLNSTINQWENYKTNRYV
jgi:hypothetical protein